MKKFLENLAIKFQRFMYGRYGADNLYKALIWFYLADVLIAVILGRAVDSVFYTIFSIIGLGIIIFAFFRVFSKNIEARRKENTKWLNICSFFKKKTDLVKNRWKFRKTHVFRKCPNCKAVLRMKKVKGKHSVTCPHCKTKFNFKVVF